MASGSPGAPGLVVPKHVVEEASRDRGFAMGPSLEESNAQGTERKLDVAMRRDVQVHNHSFFSLQTSIVSVRHPYLRGRALNCMFLYSNALGVCSVFCLTLWFCAEPHEICDEENFSNVVWKKTPAGETAAVRCPPNAVGKT